MKTLHEINEELKSLYGETSLDFTDKGAASGHSYIDFYASHFEPKRNDFVRMLEVGISSGGSAYLWGKYFNDLDYYSFDYKNEFAQSCAFQDELVGDERISLYWGQNSFDEELAKQFGSETLDFIIDDGDHHPQSQWKTFQNYWPAVAKGGVYFIEDVMTEETAKSLIPHLEFYLKGTGDKYDIDTYLGRRITEGRLDDIIIAVKKL
jgi:predicted O-methyltransferase YrrM